MASSKTDKVQALFEHHARKAQKKPVDLTDHDKADILVNAMQPHQRALHDSLSDHDAVIAPRQTGKSWGVLLLVFSRCLRKAESQWVIVGPTLESLKRIYMSVYRMLNRKFELGIRFNKTERTFHFTNGSVIHFIGADKDGEIDKVRGGAFDGVVVDESQFFPLADFDYMLEDVLEACVAARRGRLIIIGTPGSVLQGEFYLATCTPAQARPTDDGEPGPPSNYPAGSLPGEALWCKHSWSPEVNKAAPHIWARALKLKAKKGWSDTHPKWRREWLGQWVATDDVLVYRYSTWNSYRPEELPELPGGQTWRRVLGVDLGSTDGTAMVVWAYSPHSPNLYQLYSKKEVKTDLQSINVSFIVKWRNQLDELYGPFDQEVCDPGGLADIILETILDDHGIFWEKAEVRQKEDHIELFNDDLENRRIFLLRGSPLEVEMLGNRWLKDKKLNVVPPKGKRKEDPMTPNDICDAALYAFRACYHRRYISPIVQVTTMESLLLTQEKEAIQRKYRALAAHDEDRCLSLN